MIRYYFILISVLSSLSFGVLPNQEIYLQPGQKTTIVTQTDVYTISCQGNSQPTLVSKDCFCQEYGPLNWGLILSTIDSYGYMNQSVLANFQDSIQCDDKKAELKNSICKPM